MPIDAHDGDDPIEELLLSAYPNPERLGCLNPQTLHALGRLSIGENNPAWNHIWHCSPCFAEFRAIRDRRWVEHKRVVTRRKRLRCAGSVAMVALLVITTVGLISYWPFRSGRDSATASVVINLENVEALRGGTDEPNARLSLLPRKLDEVRLVLPKYMKPGHYSVAVLRSRDPNSAIALGSATAVSNQGRTELLVRLDLSTADPGRYLLGARCNDNQATSFVTVTIT